jgi:hypothetical protein
VSKWKNSRKTPLISLLFNILEISWPILKIRISLIVRLFQVMNLKWAIWSTISLNSTSISSKSQWSKQFLSTTQIRHHPSKLVSKNRNVWVKTTSSSNKTGEAHLIMSKIGNQVYFLPLMRTIIKILWSPNHMRCHQFSPDSFTKKAIITSKYLFPIIILRMISIFAFSLSTEMGIPKYRKLFYTESFNNQIYDDSFSLKYAIIIKRR